MLTMTEDQALREAALLFFRRTQRLCPDDVFVQIWTTLPEGARAALMAAEREADRLRDLNGGARNLSWPDDGWNDESGEE